MTFLSFAWTPKNMRACFHFRYERDQFRPRSSVLVPRVSLPCALQLGPAEQAATTARWQADIAAVGVAAHARAAPAARLLAARMAVVPARLPQRPTISPASVQHPSAEHDRDHSKDTKGGAPEKEGKGKSSVKPTWPDQLSAFSKLVADALSLPFSLALDAPVPVPSTGAADGDAAWFVSALADIATARPSFPAVAVSAPVPQGTGAAADASSADTNATAVAGADAHADASPTNSTDLALRTITALVAALDGLRPFALRPVSLDLLDPLGTNVFPCVLLAPGCAN